MLPAPDIAQPASRLAARPPGRSMGSLDVKGAAMGPGDTGWRRGLALVLTLLVGAAGVTVGIVRGDPLTALAGVVFAVVVFVIAGPLTRWLRRGDGPYATRSETDDEREAYARLRHNGGNGYGR